MDDLRQVKCPCCGEGNAYRLERKSVWDRLFALFSQWPYRCGACKAAFRSSIRRPVPSSAPSASSWTPKPAIRRQYRPAALVKSVYAQAVICAPDQERLNGILQTLGQAIAASNEISRAKSGPEKDVLAAVHCAAA